MSLSKKLFFRRKHINWLAMSGVLLIVLFSLPFPSLADNKSRGQDEVIIVMSEYRPYQYVENGKPMGPKVKILSHLIKEIGFKPVFKFLPWKRALHNIEMGTADLITAQMSSDRETYMDFVREPLWNLNIVAVRKKGFTDYYNGDLSSLYNLSVGVINGYSYGKKFDKAAKEGNFRFLMTTGTPKSLIRMLLTGRVDVIISNEDVAKATASSLGAEHLITVDNPPLLSNSTNIAISKRSPYSNLHKRLSELLGDMKKDGRYREALKGAFSFEDDS